MSNWDEFDKMIDAKKLNADVASCNNNSYDELPSGSYEVTLDSMDMRRSKAHDYPMLSAVFTVLEGQFKRRKIFMNQVAIMCDENDKYRINTINHFLDSLDTGLPIAFEKMSKYAQLVDDVFGIVKKDKLEYLIKLGKNKGGYTTYKIEEVYQNR